MLSPSFYQRTCTTHPMPLYMAYTPSYTCTLTLHPCSQPYASFQNHLKNIIHPIPPLLTIQLHILLFTTMSALLSLMCLNPSQTTASEHGCHCPQKLSSPTILHLYVCTHSCSNFCTLMAPLTNVLLIPPPSVMVHLSANTSTMHP